MRKRRFTEQQIIGFLKEAEVARVLEAIGQFRGLPRAIRTDQGPEFTSRALDRCAYGCGVDLKLIAAGTNAKWREPYAAHLVARKLVSGRRQLSAGGHASCSSSRHPHAAYAELTFKETAMPEYQMDQIQGALTRGLGVNILEAFELTDRYYP